MQVQEIIEEIRSGLTGDEQHDLAYLKEQMEIYKEHEFAKEILRECGRILYTLLSPEARAKIEAAAEKDNFGMDEAMEKVEFYLYKGDTEKAAAAIEPLVKKCDGILEAGMFVEDSVSEYYCFRELFEEVLHRYYSESEKAFRKASVPFERVYGHYGILLVELKRLDEAEEALKKAMSWNPADAEMLFEYAEVYKMRGDLKRFYELTLNAFRISYRPATVARCFRNLGYYFTEQKLWEVAVACIVMSQQYMPDDKNAQSELYFIEHTAGRQIDVPEFEEFSKFSEQYGFPVGASDVVLSLAARYGRHFLEEGENRLASYFLGIFYDLTGDEKVKNVLEQIKTEEN